MHSGGQEAVGRPIGKPTTYDPRGSASRWANRSRPQPNATEIDAGKDARSAEV